MKYLKDYFDKIYVINYIEAKNRRDNVKSQLEKLDLFNGVEFIYGMPFTKIKAIKPKFDELGKLNKFKSGKAVQIACSISHYTAVKTAYELDANSVLIFEDDIIFRNNRDFIIDYLDNIPKDWNYIDFNVCFTPYSINAHDLELFRTSKEKYINLKSLNAGKYHENECFNPNGLVSASAYALDREAMKLYITIFENSNFIENADMIEYFFNNISQSPLNCYTPSKRLWCAAGELNSLSYDEEKHIYIPRQDGEWLITNSAENINDNFIIDNLSEMQKSVIVSLQN